MTNRSADRWAPVGASRDILLCAPASTRNRCSCVLAVTSSELGLRMALSPETGGCNASAKAEVHPQEGPPGGGAPVDSVVPKLWNESRTNRARIADSLLVGFVHGNIS